jgi:hypothetical protein
MSFKMKINWSLLINVPNNPNYSVTRKLSKITFTFQPAHNLSKCSQTHFGQHEYKTFYCRKKFCNFQKLPTVNNYPMREPMRKVTQCGHPVAYGKYL